MKAAISGNTAAAGFGLRRPPVRYLLVFWIFVLGAVAFLDRTNLSVAGLEIAREFRIDDVHLGWVFSAFLVGYAVFQIPGGALAQRIGPRRVLLFGVLWWGLFTALTALVPPHIRGAVLVLFMVRFALGAGEATLYPATNQFVERWIPIAERGRANGLIFAGVGIGAGLTPPVVTAIILRYGWRASFWFSAVVGVIAGIVWYLIARDRPEEHPAVDGEELALIVKGRGDQGSAGIPAKNALGGRRGPSWTKILRGREILGLTLSYFSFGYVAWIFFAWFYIYLAQVRGLNLKTSAVYSMAPFLAMTIGCLLGGVASDWIARRYSRRAGRCWLAAFSMVLTAVFLILGSQADQARTAGIILACGAGVLYLAQSSFWAVSADIAGHHAGIVSGAMNMGAQIGGAVTASLTPLIAKHFGWEASFATAAVLAILGGLAWFAIDPERRLAVLANAPE